MRALSAASSPAEGGVLRTLAGDRTSWLERDVLDFAAGGYGRGLFGRAAARPLAPCNTRHRPRTILFLWAARPGGAGKRGGSLPQGGQAASGRSATPAGGWPSRKASG
jgi:hypothetical protein